MNSSFHRSIFIQKIAQAILNDSHHNQLSDYIGLSKNLYSDMFSTEPLFTPVLIPFKCNSLFHILCPQQDEWYKTQFFLQDKM